MHILANKRTLFSWILFFGLLAMTARTATDPDLWWHLRTGQWIVETARIPHTDPFSFTRTGMPWVSHEWLSEIVFYELWRLGGPTALIVFSSIITTAGFLLLYWRSPGKPYWAAAVTVLGAWASAPCWGVRPQMFTFALASLLLWLVDRAEDHPHLLFFIPPLFLLWLNLHAGFALGPALLVLYSAGLALEALTGRTPWQQARPLIARMLVVVAACLALVPFNPSGTQLYRYPFDTLRSRSMRSLIVEWFSPDFHQHLYTPFLLVLLVLFVALALSRFRIKGRVLLPLIFTLFAALDAVRHIPIFILLAIPVLSCALSSEKRVAMPHRPARVQLQLLINWTVVLLLFAFALWKWTTLARSQQTREAAQFPQSAVTFLRSNHLPERAFVYYDWGGYVIWELYPRYRVFTDGRADLYGENLLKQGIEMATRLPKNWSSVLDNWNVEVVLLPGNSPLAQALSLDPAWTVPYRDSQAVLFERKTATDVRMSSLATHEALK